MYEFVLNEYTVLELTYGECQKHKWALQKFIYNGHVWERSKWYKRFDTFEDAKLYVSKIMRREKHKHE